MRFLFVYCTAAEAEMLKCISDVITLPDEHKNIDRLNLITEFIATPNAKMSVPFQIIMTGYNLPADTVIIPTKTFTERYDPDSAESVQLYARVGRVRAEKNMVKVTP